MNRNTRRMLTAGVSILALAPLRAIAATVAGTSQTSTAATSVDLDLNLSNIASPPILGIDAVASAVVTSTADGQVYQYGSTTAGNGLVDLTMTNPTGVTIQAIAVDLGGSTAFASIENAIYQSLCACNAGGVGSATIDNDAAINIIASASVDEGSAEATAYVQEGIYQSQAGDEGGSALIDNSATGTINISAVANAVSTGGALVADAYADVDTGIYQYASASTGNSTATITNNGGITISAVANASGALDASATASVETGVYQSAYGSTAAAVTFDNQGSLLVSASANATGVTSAEAYASVTYGLYQYASAFNGDASVSLINGAAATGTALDPSAITVQAVANANAVEGSAEATAYLSYLPIYQEATGDLSASANLENNGTITISADANANGEAYAYANAEHTYTAIYQSVESTEGAASATIANNGVINITGAAKAVSVTSSASATASLSEDGIVQYAYGDTSGTAELENNGALTVNFAATATAEDFAGAYAYGETVVAYQSATASSGAASVSFVNSADGVIDVDFNALANGSSAEASATINEAFYQTAQASGGNASVTLDNQGTFNLNLLATANATAGFADAYASVNNAVVSQYAYGSTGGSGTVEFNNSGTFAVALQAVANGATGAEASAYVTEALIYQSASGSAADGSAIIDNSGALSLTVAATAVAGAGFAQASASIESAITQSAETYGDDDNAIAELTNSGTLTLAASADASGTGASAWASATGVHQYAYAETAAVTLATASISFNNVGPVGTATATAANGTYVLSATANAKADGVGGDAEATATAYSGIYQEATSLDNGDASVSITNSGSVSVLATAAATATNVGGSAEAAYAYAYAGTAFNQNAHAVDEGNATVSLDNSGALTIAANADAVADGEATASATWYGGYQWATADDDHDHNATVTFTNSGTFDLTADAEAAGGTYAYAWAFGDSAIWQGAYAENAGDPAGDASVSITNAAGASIDGVISANAAAAAGSASATASLDDFIWQSAYADEGDASVTLTNAGAISLTMTATADAGNGDAFAGAYTDETVLHQNASSTEGSSFVTLTNDGSIDVLVSASAAAVGTGATDSAYASAWAEDVVVYQSAVGSTVTLTNNGDMTIGFAANAAGDESASAYAGVSTAVYQSAEGTAPSLNFVNSATGVFDVSADATATADEAYAYAIAGGVYQFTGDPGTFTFNNAGSFSVAANADANGATEGSATATAQGYYGEGSPGLAFSNSGTFNVTATAAGLDDAYAYAIGAEVDGSEGTGTITGTMTNAGTITVVADADASGLAGVTAVTPQLGSAYATGIYMHSNTNAATITNSGTIDVSAIVDGGTNVGAWGIYIGNNGAPTATGSMSIVNAAGNIWASESNDGGATFTWGDAINTVNAPNAVAISLLGDGSTYLGAYPAGPVDHGDIYGNIELSSDDTVNVAFGETWFDGLVNAPAYAAWSDGDALTDPDTYATGSLTIEDDGLLFLRDDRGETGDSVDYAGPAHVFVDSFTMEAGGVLALELPSDPTGGAQTVDTYPSVYATEADITGGILEVRPSSSNGLYDDDYFFDNVVETGAGGLTGTFADVRTTSVLLDADDTYDADGNVDLDVSRVAFDGVAGLNINQSAVGGAIEGTYSSALDATNPEYANLLATLFTIADPVEYANALDALSADQYAGYLRSLSWLGTRFNGLMNDMSECGRGIPHTELCRSPGDPRIWAEFNIGTVDTDGDAEASAFDGDQMFIALGIDMALSENFVLGIAGAYVENDLDFDLYDGQIDSDGWQLGLYGNYDTGTVYVKGSFSYSDLNADSERTISIGQGLSPWHLNGTTNPVAGTIVGSPDASIWSVAGEVGYRFPVSATATLTPYLALDYASVDLNSFTESGVPGANLTIDGSDDYFTGEIGVELAFEAGNVRPYVKAGYQHNFSDSTADFQAAFADGPSGTDFNVISEDFSDGSGVIEAGLAAELGPNFDAHIGYQGRFSSDVQQHAGGITLSYLFGAAEPAPPPPPPPPPPPQAVCNKGPYIVFFDWDKSDITPEAATILDSAITAYGNCDVVPIMLAGYADRSGSVQYNVGLSQRRNTSVTGYLTTRGIPGERISSGAFGESNPRVPTADGVRELQNRRVEITYGPGSGM